MIDTILFILLILFLTCFILSNYCRFLKHNIKNSKAVNEEFIDKETNDVVDKLLQQLKERENKHD